MTPPNNSGFQGTDERLVATKLTRQQQQLTSPRQPGAGSPTLASHDQSSGIIFSRNKLPACLLPCTPTGSLPHGNTAEKPCVQASWLDRNIPPALTKISRARGWGFAVRMYRYVVLGTMIWGVAAASQNKPSSSGRVEKEGRRCLRGLTPLQTDRTRLWRPREGSEPLVRQRRHRSRRPSRTRGALLFLLREKAGRSVQYRQLECWEGVLFAVGTLSRFF